MIPEIQASTPVFSNFQSSLEKLQSTLQRQTESTEDLISKKVLAALSFAHTQAECIDLANFLETNNLSQRSDGSLTVCLKILQLKQEVLDPGLTGLKKVQRFVQKSREYSFFASVIKKEDFSKNQIEVRYQEDLGTIDPYNLFLLASHSEALSRSLNWLIKYQKKTPPNLMITKTISEHIISALQEEVFSLSIEEQSLLLSEIRPLLFNQKGLELLLPLCSELLENEACLEDLINLLPLFLTSEENLIYLLDKPLANALEQVNFENQEESLQENLKTISDLYWKHSSSLPLTNQALRKLFTPLVISAMEQGTLEQNAFLQEVSPPLSLGISPKSIALLENPFVKRCLARSCIKMGKAGFYIQALTLLLKCRKEALENLFIEDPSFLFQVKAEFNDNFDVVKAAVLRNGRALEFASNRLKNNFKIVKTAILQNGLVVAFASDRLKDNFEIAREAVLQNGHALTFISDRLKDNFEIAREAVSQNGFTVSSVSDRLKDNFEIAKAAVLQDGLALVFVSDRLKDDFEIVKTAVLQHKHALQYASDRLKNDQEIIWASRRSP